MPTSSSTATECLIDALPRIWPNVFHTPFNQYQTELIEDLEKHIRRRGYVRWRPGTRGQGNTCILAAATVWAILEGLHEFAVIANRHLLMEFLVELVEQANVPEWSVKRGSIRKLLIGDRVIAVVRHLSKGISHTRGEGRNRTNVRPTMIVVDGRDNLFMSFATAYSGGQKITAFMVDAPDQSPSRGPSLIQAMLRTVADATCEPYPEFLIGKPGIVSNVLATLNAATADDRVAMQSLIETRVPCNEAMGDHPTIQVCQEPDGLKVGALGVINGIVESLCRASGEGCCRIAAQWEDGQLLGFVPYEEQQRRCDQWRRLLPKTGVPTMSEKKSSVSVRVRCVVDIPVGKWGSDCVLGQLGEQAKREGQHIVEAMVREKGGRLYSTPKVVFVMVEEGEDQSTGTGVGSS